jgi:CysZ protein
VIIQFTRGARYVGRGWGLLNQSGVRRYVIIPLLINVTLFGTAIWYSVDQFETFLNWLLPSWLEWARPILWPLFAAAAALVLFSTFTLIANLIGAPFNGVLAEKLEARLTGQPLPSQSWTQIARASVAAILNELRKLAYLVARTIPLLILFLIPGLNVFAPLAWLAFSAWMLALEYIDAPMGNHDLTFRDGRRVLGKHRSLALGFGGAVLLMTSIPVLNFFAMPVGVAGATAMWVEQLNPSTNRNVVTAQTR